MWACEMLAEPFVRVADEVRLLLPGARVGYRGAFGLRFCAQPVGFLVRLREEGVSVVASLLGGFELGVGA